MDPSITPLTSLNPIAPVAPVAPASRTQPTDAVAPTSGVSTTIDTIPASPPSEVLDAIGAAAGRFEELAAQNQQVSFTLGGDGGRVQVHVQDLQGNPISSALAPSSVFNILDGKA